MRRSLVAVALVALAACQDRGPTGPESFVQPQASLVQQPGFYFISPAPPGSPVGSGEFNGRLAPVVEICRLDGDVCMATYYAFFTTQGSPHGDAITIDAQNEEYRVAWTMLQELRSQPGSKRYRIHVSSNFRAQDHHFFGSVDINLTDGPGGGVYVPDNTLQIRFRIEEGALCQAAACLEFSVSNDEGGQFILEQVEDDDVGTFGLDFTAGFCSTGDCLGSITVIVERYRGPERCIPVSYDAIQYEVCVRVRTIPEAVTFNPFTVHVGICVDPRAATLETAGLLRLLKVKEDAGGSAIPGTIEDVNAETVPFFFDCREDFWTEDELAAAPATGLLPRLAATTSRAMHALAPLVRMFSPRPAHALRRLRGPYVGSLEDFSRLGTVAAVTGEFDQDNGAGSEGALLAPSEQPRVRVLAVQNPHPTTVYPPGTPATLPVPFVQVRFTAHQGTVNPSIDVTDAQGYVSAQWTLGTVADNPHSLTAEIGAPEPFAGVTGVFPNFDGSPAFWWASHTFAATAQAPAQLYSVHFLPPLSDNPDGGGSPNVSTVAPAVRICGPLAEGATAAPGQSCDAALTKWVPAAKLKVDFWETAWKTDRSTPADRLFRLDVVIGGQAMGSVLLRTGGGGGFDGDGTRRVQVNSNLPVKFTVEE